MEAERSSTSIEQWYEYATNLDRHWRESKREEEKLRRKRDTGPQASGHNQEA